MLQSYQHLPVVPEAEEHYSVQRDAGLQISRGEGLDTKLDYSRENLKAQTLVLRNGQPATTTAGCYSCLPTPSWVCFGEFSAAWNFRWSVQGFSGFKGRYEIGVSTPVAQSCHKRRKLQVAETK